MSGNLFIVSAPSGAGKSSLVKALLARDPHIHLSISHTTRAPRPGEVNGREYHFVDRETFKAMQARGEFLESAEVYGNFYGTSRAGVEAQRAAGSDILLEIDWQGAERIRTLIPEAIGIFILPPSLAALKSRLEGRGQDSAEIIAGRLAAAQDDIAHAHASDYVLINDVFETALEDLLAVCRGQRQRQRSETHALVTALLAN
ncbi:MAG: guanylate kinase [Betaproteobacteria bacterium]|nr:guanylate kinase [Betaproteobacteria bacterium]